MQRSNMLDIGLVRMLETNIWGIAESDSKAITNALNINRIYWNFPFNSEQSENVLSLPFKLSHLTILHRNLSFYGAHFPLAYLLQGKDIEYWQNSPTVDM